MAPETVYPASHVGWQNAPWVNAPLSGQLPSPPLAGATFPEHGLAVQVVFVSRPAEHVVTPYAVYPALHVG